MFPHKKFIDITFNLLFLFSQLQVQVSLYAQICVIIYGWSWTNKILFEQKIFNCMANVHVSNVQICIPFYQFYVNINYVGRCDDGKIREKFFDSKQFTVRLRVSQILAYFIEIYSSGLLMYSRWTINYSKNTCRFLCMLSTVTVDIFFVVVWWTFVDSVFHCLVLFDNMKSCDVIANYCI